MHSIHRYFKVGLIHFMAWPEVMKGSGPVAQTLMNILTDEYFDAVEISWIQDDQERRRVRDLLAQSHMTVCYGAQPRLLTTGLNPNDLSEPGRRAAEQTLLAAIDEADYLGAGGIAFLSGPWQEKTREQSYAQLIKTTKNLCAYAQQKGMKVELEVFDYDIDKKALIGPAPYAAQFAAEIRNQYDNFGLIVDLSHLPLTYEEPSFALRTLSPYITHLHIGNAVTKKGAPAYGDAHPRFGFPNSANDVEQTLAFLRACRDEGLMNAQEPLVLSFEVKPWDNEESAIVVANAKRVLNRAWALLDE